jgi:hypothetical protein
LIAFAALHRAALGCVIAKESIHVFETAHKLKKGLLCKISVSLLLALAWTSLATFQQVKKTFENVRSLQQHLDWEVQEDGITQRLGSNQHSPEVAELELD